MNLETEIKKAASELERLLNLLPNQLSITCEQQDVTEIQNERKTYLHKITIKSTHPVQIYP